MNDLRGKIVKYCTALEKAMESWSWNNPAHSFCRRGNWSPERLNALPMVTQLAANQEITHSFI